MLADWRTAPVDEPLRSTLGLLERTTLDPGSLSPEDVEAVRGAGASDDAIVDALHVAALFAVVDRVADALGFAIPDPAYFVGAAPRFYDGGYLPD